MPDILPVRMQDQLHRRKPDLRKEQIRIAGDDEQLIQEERFDRLSQIAPAAACSMELRRFIWYTSIEAMDITSFWT